MQELSTNVSGFYYDSQLDNKLLSVTLHGNAIPPDKNNPGGDWTHVPDSEADDEVYNTPKEGGEVWKYSKIPLAKSIITEDFNVSISNTWTPFGGDPISQIWNEQKPMAPYIGELANALATIAKKTASYDFSGSTIPWLSNGGGQKLASFFDSVSKAQLRQSKLLSRSLVVQGTRFTYFGGTGTDFGNLNMKFMVFAGYNADGVWKSVKDQIEPLIPYIIGDFVPLDVDLGKGGVGEDVSKFVNEFAQWQLPPGGFEANLKNIDVVQQGTLKLNIGPYYALTNLVLSNAQFNYSKNMVKNPEKWKSDRAPELEPMYCDVMLNLRPATLYSKNSMMNFIGGHSNQNMRSEFQTEMQKSLWKTKTNKDLLLHNKLS